MGRIYREIERGVYAVGLIGGIPCLIIFTLIIGEVKECAGEKVDKIDNSINIRKYAFKNLYVTDSIRNGFEVVYQTVNDVTSARLDEIRSRQHVKEAFMALKNDAPIHFGLMLNTDIYDFAEFAKRYDYDKDVKINAIFVSGRDKEAMYQRPSPRGATFASGNEIFYEQGIQYIYGSDIYPYAENPERTYRYWQCNGTYSTSTTDERYSHVELREIRRP